VTQTAVGVGCAAIVAIAAYRLRALSAGGAAAAFVVGAIVFSRGGWPAAGVLFAFFIPSTLLSRLGADRKRAIASGEQHGPRNGWQVLANGGVAAACALAMTLGAPFAAAFAGAFAAASADTWGTEVGMLSHRPPFSILTLRTERAGISGAVTPLGIAATFGGALFVAAVASLTGFGSLLAVALGGIAGALLDSVLGASLQALRFCPACAQECETQRHHCGAATVLRRGFRWIENDAVNFTATLCGAAVAFAVAAS
jgi:uncharacterized protein (TIGR00297 family)